MKHIFKQTSSIVVGLLMCTACNNWLDIQPSDRIAEDRVFSQVSGFWGALNGVYTELLSSNLYGGFLTVQGVEVMAQRYNVSQNQETFYNLSQYAFTQEQVKLRLESYWNEAYKQILECNNILENAEVRHGEVLNDKQYNLIRAEALALRGFLHFDLLRMFGPLPTQLDSKAIPYKETISVSAPGMLTGNEVIEKVLTDLAEAESILKNWDPAVSEGMLMAVNDDDHDNDGNTYRFRGLRLNYYAVVALKARVYLWAGNKTEALKYAKMIIENPEAETGEIQVRGENVMTGYYKNPEATQEVFTEDGWLRTGDLGTMDANGNIFIRGRLKTMILSSSGQNIFPEEIEAKLNNLPFILESLIIERNKKLVALVYADYESLDSLGLNQPENLKTIMDENLKNLNASVANYEKISQIQLYPTEFEKTPKRSIKRYLYNSIAVN